MIEKGNIAERVASRTENYGWIMGDFIRKNDIFYSDKVEIKYITHQKWEIHTGSTTEIFRKTLVILLSGRAEFYFGEAKFTLTHPMDYVIDTEIPGEHTVKFLEDITLLVIRHY